MRVALLHDSLNTFGGAERVFLEITRIFPAAPVFVLERSTALRSILPQAQASFLQRIPHLLRRTRVHLPLLPIAAETFDLSRFDVVLSSTSSFAKGLVTRPGTLHICYCHAPTRFLWDAYHDLLRERRESGKRSIGFPLVMHALRLWDYAAARRVDLFLTNSETTRERIQKYYRRDAVVIHPPLSLSEDPRTRMEETPRRFFLFVGRLSPYKRAALVIETFLKLDLPLLVVGQGREWNAVQRRVRPPVRLCGQVTDAQLIRLYRGARAVVFPSDDDFGLVPIEALAAGTPVLALRRGGAVETIREGVTGEFFDEPTEEFLGDCVRRFLEREGSYDRRLLRAVAAQFSARTFATEIREVIAQAWRQWIERRKVAVS